MTVMETAEWKERVECSNCGETENLLKCSRCRNAWFCGVKCQKQYWPFHKPACRKNDFADAIEENEPKFATWMRKHGKLAVMKDDEVDRLERAGTAVSGATRQEVMESMYGRVDPKPKEPIYSIEERQAMKQKEQEMKEAAHEMALIPSSYRQIDVPQDLGLDCGSYKWKQNQTYVEIYILLPHTDSIASKVVVELKPGHISVEINERPFLRGPLYREIKAEDSTWYIQDGVLEITLLKYSRRSQYANGETNADTFWKSVLKTAQETEIICLQHPPSNYYTFYYEVDGQQKRLVTGRKK